MSAFDSANSLSSSGISGGRITHAKDNASVIRQGDGKHASGILTSTSSPEYLAKHFPPHNLAHTPTLSASCEGLTEALPDSGSPLQMSTGSSITTTPSKTDEVIQGCLVTLALADDLISPADKDRTIRSLLEGSNANALIMSILALPPEIDMAVRHRLVDFIEGPARGTRILVPSWQQYPRGAAQLPGPTASTSLSTGQLSPHDAGNRSTSSASSSIVLRAQPQAPSTGKARESKNSDITKSEAAVAVAKKRKEALATGAKAFKNLTKVYGKTKFDGPSLAQELEAVHNLPVKECSPLNKAALLKTLLEAGKDALDGNIIRQHFAQLLRGPQAEATRGALVDFLSGQAAKSKKPELIRQLLTLVKQHLNESLVRALRDQILSVSEDCLDSLQKMEVLVDLYRLGHSSLSTQAIKEYAKVPLSLPTFNSTVYTDRLRLAHIGPEMVWKNVLLAASLFNLCSSSLSQSDLVELTTTILDCPDGKFSAEHKLYMVNALLVPENPEEHTATALAIRAGAVIAIPGDKIDAQTKDSLLSGIYCSMQAHDAAMGLLDRSAMRVPWADRLWLIVWLYLTAGYSMASKEQVILAATKIISVTESDINARNILLNALIGGAKSIVESDVVLTLPTGERFGPFPLPVVHEAIESVIAKGKDSKEKT